MEFDGYGLFPKLEDRLDGVVDFEDVLSYVKWIDEMELEEVENEIPTRRSFQKMVVQKQKLLVTTGDDGVWIGSNVLFEELKEDSWIGWCRYIPPDLRVLLVLPKRSDGVIWFAGGQDVSIDEQGISESIKSKPKNVTKTLDDRKFTDHCLVDEDVTLGLADMFVVNKQILSWIWVNVLSIYRDAAGWTKTEFVGTEVVPSSIYKRSDKLLYHEPWLMYLNLDDPLKITNLLCFNAQQKPVAIKRKNPVPTQNIIERSDPMKGKQEEIRLTQINKERIVDLLNPEAGGIETRSDLDKLVKEFVDEIEKPLFIDTKPRPTTFFQKLELMARDTFGEINAMWAHIFESGQILSRGMSVFETASLLDEYYGMKDIEQSIVDDIQRMKTNFEREEALKATKATVLQWVQAFQTRVEKHIEYMKLLSNLVDPQPIADVSYRPTHVKDAILLILKHSEDSAYILKSLRDVLKDPSYRNQFIDVAKTVEDGTLWKLKHVDRDTFMNPIYKVIGKLWKIVLLHLDAEYRYYVENGLGDQYPVYSTIGIPLPVDVVTNPDLYGLLTEDDHVTVEKILTSNIQEKLFIDIKTELENEIAEHMERVQYTAYLASTQGKEFLDVPHSTVNEFVSNFRLESKIESIRSFIRSLAKTLIPDIKWKQIVKYANKKFRKDFDRIKVPATMTRFSRKIVGLVNGVLAHMKDNVIENEQIVENLRSIDEFLVRYKDYNDVDIDRLWNMLRAVPVLESEKSEELIVDEVLFDRLSSEDDPSPDAFATLIQTTILPGMNDIEQDMENPDDDIEPLLLERLLSKLDVQNVHTTLRRQQALPSDSVASTIYPVPDAMSPEEMRSFLSNFKHANRSSRYSVRDNEIKELSLLFRFYVDVEIDVFRRNPDIGVDLTSRLQKTGGFYHLIHKIWLLRTDLNEADQRLIDLIVKSP